MSRTCTKCKKNKPLSDFYRDKKGVPYSSCKECELAKQKRLRKLKPDVYRWRDRNKRLFKDYGITTTQYNEILQQQNECCLICGTHQSKLDRPLDVDHCHNGEFVRGLLCRHCNTGLGHFKDNVNTLLNAINYLNKWQSSR